MVESSDEPSFLDRIRSWAKSHVSTYTSSGAGDQHPALPLTNIPSHLDAGVSNQQRATVGDGNIDSTGAGTTRHDVADNTSTSLPPPAPPPPNEEGHGEASSAIGSDDEASVFIRFYQNMKEIMLSSWLNLLLVFVPVGIAVNFAGVSPTIVFAMNAIAIIPLAGLLSHATESVASKMGDTVGALMNVTFGNAVELIIL